MCAPVSWKFAASGKRLPTSKVVNLLPKGVEGRRSGSRLGWGQVSPIVTLNRKIPLGPSSDMLDAARSKWLGITFLGIVFLLVWWDLDSPSCFGHLIQETQHNRSHSGRTVTDVPGLSR
jgi:hypothetical protein